MASEHLSTKPQSCWLVGVSLRDGTSPAGSILLPRKSRQPCGGYPMLWELGLTRHISQSTNWTNSNPTLCFFRFSVLDEIWSWKPVPKWLGWWVVPIFPAGIYHLFIPITRSFPMSSLTKFPHLHRSYPPLNVDTDVENPWICRSCSERESAGFPHLNVTPSTSRDQQATFLSLVLPTLY